MNPIRVVSLFVVLIVAMSARAAAAQDYELAFSLGYGQLSLDGDANLDGQGGGRFEPRFSWRPFPSDRPEVRFGVGLGFASYYDESDAGTIVAPPFDFDVEDYEDISLVTPEFQVSWREPLGEKWWVEAGVGVGPVFGFYSAGQVVFDDLIDEDVSEHDAGLGVRPFVRAAWHNERWSVGLEGSYQWTTIDFGEAFGGDASEWYVGLFVGFGR